MDLTKGKLFAVKLNEKRINNIISVCELYGIDYNNKSASVIFDLLISAIFNKIEEKTVKPEFSEIEIKTQRNNILSEISSFHLDLINIFLKNEIIIRDFSKMNKSGKMNGIFDVINTDDENKNILNFLTGVLTGSANGMILKKGIISKEDLKNKINIFLSKQQSKENE